MAHFAELDENNIVLRVVVIRNEDTATANGVEDETIGITFCHNLYGGNWIQTSYNNNFRSRYAGIGYTYDKELDAFLMPQPFPSWVLNTETLLWKPPVPRPTDGKLYSWDEPTLSWIESL